MYQRQLQAMFLVFMLLLAGCHHNINPSPEVASDSKFVEYSIKTIKSIDIACDVIYTILGEMYKSGKITEAQKDELINIGNGVSASLRVAKDGVRAYMWAEQMSEKTTVTKDKAINDLIIAAKTFYKLRDQAAIIYKSATGKSIQIPDIFMFNTITDALMRG